MNKEMLKQGKAYLREQGISTLFTKNNPKLEKGNKKYSVLNVGISLMPHYKDTCPFSTRECRKLCLHVSGMRFNQARKNRARIARTMAYLNNPRMFMLGALEEMARIIRNAASKGIADVFIRPNIVSDIDYPVWFYKAVHDIAKQNDVNIWPYEYTKDWNNGKKESVCAEKQGLLYRVYSAHENTTIGQIKEKVNQGKPVAVVFRDYYGNPDELPKYWHDMPIIDGVQHDLRAWDCNLAGAPRGHIVALAPIGIARKHLGSPFMFTLFEG